MNTEIKIGSKIRRRFNCDDDGAFETEVGVVVHIWRDPETNLDDAYIAFFGQNFPEGVPDEKPYILRYFVGGLELVE